MFEPSYIKLYESGELKARVDEAVSRLANCNLCPRKCEVNRLKGERGFCGVGRLALISSFGPHFGEEASLVGTNGSGTIFIGGCNLKCIFCQNFEISHQLEGEEATSERFAKLMLWLQEIGCHNINIVTPSHIVPQILEALLIAIPMGLNLPLVYNTGGYDEVSTLKLLDGVVDIYMPDFKFSAPEVANKFTGASDYPAVAKLAIAEMHRQVGDLIIKSKIKNQSAKLQSKNQTLENIKEGVAVRGLLVRHLVLPDGLAGTREVAKFLANLSKETYINIMDQYRPCGEAYKFSELTRRITGAELKLAINEAKEARLHRFDKKYFVG